MIMKKYMVKLAFSLALAIPLFLVGNGGGTARAADPAGDFVAVAYTLPGYAGVVWKIPKPGSYDLRKEFGLPNDSICCIAVAPGYRVTIYEHAGFGGESVKIDKDELDLRDRSRWASSLKVEKTGDADKTTWLAVQNGDAVPAFKIDPMVPKFADALQNHKERIEHFRNAEEMDWYGETTNAERVEVGGELLTIFSDCGVDVDEWTPNTFAQMMNNFYDWRKDMSVWDMACLVLNVDPGPFKQ
jgi:hypothetical protein